jgi:hypothetical protein
VLVNIDRHAFGPVNLVVRLADQRPFDPGQLIGRRTCNSYSRFEPTLDFHLRLCAFDQ